VGVIGSAALDPRSSAATIRGDVSPVCKRFGPRSNLVMGACPKQMGTAWAVQFVRRLGTRIDQRWCPSTRS